jgi:hypothetical protein
MAAVWSAVHGLLITSKSFEKVTYAANLHSEADHNYHDFAADLEVQTDFCSAYRQKKEDIPHMRNNWVCSDFKKRRIVPTHYTVRTNVDGPGVRHLKSWLVETSADGRSPTKKTTSNSMAALELGNLRLRVAGSAASSGW